MPYENSQRARFHAGDFVIQRGDAGDDIYILQDGEVEVIKYDRMGQGYVIATLASGQAFGEMGFIMEEPRDISVRALTAIEVDIVSTRVFADLYDLEDIGRLIRPIIQAFSERLRHTYAKVSEMEAQEKVQVSKTSAYPDHIEVVFTPRTKRALDAMNGLKVLSVDKLPFYIGRHSHRRSDNLFHANELFLYDQVPYTVSRSHCAIVATLNAVYFVDRGSTLGSVVNGIRIGGTPYAPKKANLNMGENEIILGESGQEAYVFTATISLK